MTTPDAARLLLRLLAEGQPLEEASRELTPEGVRAAAKLALDALKTRPRVESRAERIARLREKHPRAYEPWSEDEDAHLLRRFDEGARVADLSRELMRQPNAIRARLERWLGPSWKERGVERSGED